MKNKESVIFFFMSLIIYISFNAYIPVTDPVEANYALTAKEMLLQGDWLSPRIYGQIWYDKPVLFYVLIIISYKLFGVNEFAARLPSAFFASLSIGFINWLSLRLYRSTNIARLTSMVLGTSLQFWILGKMIITDMVLFFFMSVALGAFYLCFLEYGDRWMYIFYAATAFAVLTKGPVGIVLPGLIILAYVIINGNIKKLLSFLSVKGMTVCIALFAPWYIYMWINYGGEFVNTFLGLHNYLRATVSEHPKDDVFYYYLILLPVATLPWTGILIKSLLKKQNSLEQNSHKLFLVVWLMGIVVFYSLMATKYPTYVFPALFPAALLCGCELDNMLRQQSRNTWMWLTGPAALLLCIMAYAAKIMQGYNGNALFYFLTVIALVTLVSIHIIGRFRLLPIWTTISVLLVSMALTSTTLIPYASSRSFKPWVDLLPLEKVSVGVIGDYPTSMVYYSGQQATKIIARKELKPDAWSAKYTMPMATYENFFSQIAESDNVYIFVNNTQLPSDVKQIIDKEYELVSNSDRAALYRKTL